MVLYCVVLWAQILEALQYCHNLMVDGLMRCVHAKVMLLSGVNGVHEFQYRVAIVRSVRQSVDAVIPKQANITHYLCRLLKPTV